MMKEMMDSGENPEQSAPLAPRARGRSSWGLSFQIDSKTDMTVWSLSLGSHATPSPSEHPLFLRVLLLPRAALSGSPSDVCFLSVSLQNVPLSPRTSNHHWECAELLALSLCYRQGSRHLFSDSQTAQGIWGSSDKPCFLVTL